MFLLSFNEMIFFRYAAPPIERPRAGRGGVSATHQPEITSASEIIRFVALLAGFISKVGVFLFWHVGSTLPTISGVRVFIGDAAYLVFRAFSFRNRIRYLPAPPHFLPAESLPFGSFVGLRMNSPDVSD